MNLRLILNRAPNAPVVPQPPVAIPSITTFKFLALPPEVRNMVYELLLVNDGPIHITSPRKKYYYEGNERKPRERTFFACLLRVNKQINTETKTTFFSQNTFIVGTGLWAATSQANLQGLKTFISRVPKHCVSLIQRLELDVACDIRHSRNYEYNVSRSASRDLRTLCGWLSKDFSGVKVIIVAAIEHPQLCKRYGDLETWPRSLDRQTLGKENIKVIAAALQMLLTLPSLDKLRFNTESIPRWRNMEEFAISTWMTAVLKREHKHKSKIELWRKG